jgi:hypothetical protein
VGVELRCGLCVALGLVMLAGCAGSEGSVRVPTGHDVEWELRQVRREVPHPIFYLGRRFERLPLTAVNFHTPPAGQVSFSYGTCTIPLPADGGCGVPVSVQSFPFRAEQWRAAVGCYRVAPVRGVPTVRHDGLALLTRHGVIKIYARTRAQERRAAAALRPVGAQRPHGAIPRPRVREVHALELGCGSLT